MFDKEERQQALQVSSGRRTGSQLTTCLALLGVICATTQPTTAGGPVSCVTAEVDFRVVYDTGENRRVTKDCTKNGHQSRGKRSIVSNA